MYNPLQSGESYASDRGLRQCGMSSLKNKKSTDTALMLNLAAVRFHKNNRIIFESHMSFW